MTVEPPETRAAGGHLYTRPATPADAPTIATIYNEGIADRVATFETEPRSAEDIAAWFTPGRPVMVAEGPPGIVAFAAAFPYSTRPCYAGVNEFSVYVAREDRHSGAGRAVLTGLENSMARGAIASSSSF